MRSPGAVGPVVRRYAPFLLVLVAQAILVGLLPSVGPERTELTALGAPPPLSGAPAGTGTGTGSVVPGEQALDPTTGQPLPEGSVPGAPAVAGGAGPAQPGAPGAGDARPGAPGAPAVVQTGGPQAAAGGPQGDRSHCTPDGRQQGVTGFSAPCVAKFTGDNGGATYQGVEGDTIKAVLVRNTFGPVVDAALRGAGLAASPEEEESTMKDFAAFFNKRYETYGREVEWVYYYAECDMSQSVDCARGQAKKINQQFKPFLVATPLAVLPEYFDELSRAGVVNLGGWHFTREYMQRLRPFHYDWMPDGTRVARNIANYWCQKAAGKNAVYAGDAALRDKPRKLAVVVASTEQPTAQADQLLGFIAEGCGGASTVPKVYQYSPDFSRSQGEFSTIVTALRQDGVTTVLCLCDPIRPTFLTSAATTGRYFPEHLLSGMGASDHDYFGRIYDQEQWKNSFGPGFNPTLVAKEKQDDFKAYQDVGAEYRCYACLANFIWMHLATIQMQYAGPNLTPLTVEQGTLNAAPIGGFDRTGDPLVPLVQFGPGEYTALNDTRNITWDPNAPSPIDGRPGSYVCIDAGCRRYEIGRWTAGDPRKPQ